MRELTSQQVYDKRQRAFRAAMGAMKVLAAKAHPETGGMEMLVHNWGNAEAKRQVARAWARWDKYHKASDAAYDAALHRDHVRANEVGRYLWCQHCRAYARKAELV